MVNTCGAVAPRQRMDRDGFRLLLHVRRHRAGDSDPPPAAARRRRPARGRSRAARGHRSSFAAALQRCGRSPAPAAAARGSLRLRGPRHPHPRTGGTPHSPRGCRTGSSPSLSASAPGQRHGERRRRRSRHPPVPVRALRQYGNQSVPAPGCRPAPPPSATSSAGSTMAFFPACSSPQIPAGSVSTRP